MCLFSVKDLCVEAYGGKGCSLPLLKNVDIAVGENRVTALIGESGAGKTLLAKAMAALLPAGMRVTGGRFFYKGEEVDQDWLKRARGTYIFYAPQNAAASFNPVVRIKKQIMETAQIPKEELLDILAFLNLDDPARVLNAYPCQLSEGENQRALLALALSLRAEIVILDEPTSALDTDSQHDFMKLIEQTRARFKVAFLLVSHNLALVRHSADRIYILLNGRIVDQGVSEILFKNPSHRYTKEIVAFIDEKK